MVDRYMSKRGRFAQMLSGGPNLNNGSIGGGLAEMLKSGLQGYMLGADQRDQRLADEAMMAPNAQARLTALRGLEGNEYAGRLARQLNADQEAIAARQKEIDSQLVPVFDQNVNAMTYQPRGNIQPGMMASAPEQPKKPSGVQEYEYAKSQGFPGSFEDWKTNQTKAGATTVNMPPGHAKGLEALQKGDAERIIGLEAGASKLREIMPDLARIEEANAKFNTGPTANIRLFLGAFANELGFSVDTDTLSEGEIISSIQNRLAPAMRETGSGSSSDRDVAMFLDALPNLMRSPEGNRKVVQHIRSIYERKAQEAAFLRNWFHDKGGDMRGAIVAMDQELQPLNLDLSAPAPIAQPVPDPTQVQMPAPNVGPMPQGNALDPQFLPPELGGPPPSTQGEPKTNTTPSGVKWRIVGS